jgi:hypothetical protein
VTLPEFVNVDSDQGPMIHQMTKGGQLTQMTLMEAQLAHVRLGNAIAAALPASGRSGGAGAARPMTAKMNRKLHALLGELGITGDARHPALSRMLGRPITSASDLDFDDAMSVIAALEAQVAARRPARTGDEPF